MLLIKIDQICNMRQIVLSLIKNLSKILQGETKELLMETYRESLKGQCASNPVIP